MSDMRQRGPNHSTSRGRVADRTTFFSASDVGAAKQRVVDARLVSHRNPYGMPSVEAILREVDATEAQKRAEADAAEAQVAFMKMAWEQGCSASEIAQETGTNQWLVQQRAKRGKWRRK